MTFKYYILGLIVCFIGKFFSSPLQAQILSVKIQTQGHQAIKLNWLDSGSSYTYAVEYRDSLEKDDWKLLPRTGGWPARIFTFEDTLQEGTGSRFYRVVASSMTQDADRGKLISWELVDELSAFQLNFGLALSGIDSFIAEQGVKIYKLTYETIDVHGRVTMASGQVAFPENKNQALPLASYQHGTVINTD